MIVLVYCIISLFYCMIFVLFPGLMLYIVRSIYVVLNVNAFYRSYSGSLLAVFERKRTSLPTLRRSSVA